MQILRKFPQKTQFILTICASPAAIPPVDSPAQFRYTEIQKGVGMRLLVKRTAGFTLLEVTFATGITLLAFGMLLGAVLSLTTVRDTTQRRLQNIAYLQQCMETVSALSVEEAREVSLEPVQTPAGIHEARLELLEAPAFAAKITVSTRTLRGHLLESSAVCVLGGSTDAP